jgi:hypothetical protein
MNHVSHAPHPDIWEIKHNKIILQQWLQVFNHGVIIQGIVYIDGDNL